MKDDILNKRLAIYNNYDDFGKNSYNYIKGNDYVAFLINENEVIYWINLEVIWKQLGIIVTNTENVTENGDTIVNIKLSGNNNVIYDYLPSIPDEERINSLSNFCTNYPYIKHINLNNTINLTDISNAFNNITIDSFSLYTNNVTNAVNCFNNTIINCDISLNFDNPNVNIDSLFAKSSCKNNTITINANFESDKYYHIIYNYDTYNLFNYDIYKFIFNRNLEITTYANNIDNYIKANNVLVNILNDIYDVNQSYSNNIQHIEANKVELDFAYSAKYYNCEVTCDIIYIGQLYAYNVGRKKIKIKSSNVVKEVGIDITYMLDASNVKYTGYGCLIKIDNNTKITFLNDDASDYNYRIPAYIFNVKVVDDNFLSIFNNKVDLNQLNDDFDVLSDINLIDSKYKDLCYFNIQSTDTKILEHFTNNIIIKNGFVPTLRTYDFTIFDNIIIDTYEYAKNFDVYDYPDFVFMNYGNISISNGYMRGFYKLNDNVNGYWNGLRCEFLNEVTAYINTDEVIYIYCNDYNNADFLYEKIKFIPKDKNINNIIKVNIIEAGDNGAYSNFNFDISSFIYNNECNVYITSSQPIFFKYNPDITFYPVEFMQAIRYISKNDKICNVINDMIISQDDLVDNIDEIKDINSVYLNFVEDNYMPIRNTFNWNEKPYGNVVNLYGNINADFNVHSSRRDCDFVHIDFNKIKTGNYIDIIRIPNLDESSIKKIPNALIDNSSTEEEIKTPINIIMFRSQYNYLNETDTNIILSKNYEIAITEN